MHTSAVTQAEILTGIALLPAGKRRTALAIAADHMFEQDFENIDGLTLVTPGKPRPDKLHDKAKSPAWCGA